MPSESELLAFELYAETLARYAALSPADLKAQTSGAQLMDFYEDFGIVPAKDSSKHTAATICKHLSDNFERRAAGTSIGEDIDLLFDGHMILEELVAKIKKAHNQTVSIARQSVPKLVMPKMAIDVENIPVPPNTPVSPKREGQAVLSVKPASAPAPRGRSKEVRALASDKENTLAIANGAVQPIFPFEKKLRAAVGMKEELRKGEVVVKVNATATQQLKVFYNEQTRASLPSMGAQTTKGVLDLLAKHFAKDSEKLEAVRHVQADVEKGVRSRSQSPQHSKLGLDRQKIEAGFANGHNRAAAHRFGGSASRGA